MTDSSLSLTEVAAGGARWHVAESYRDLLLGPEGLRLEAWVRDGRAQTIKEAPHRTIYRVRLPGLDFHLKHYPLPNLRSWLRQLVRPSKARSEFERARAVAGRGVATVTPLGFGELGSGFGPGESYLLTQTLHETEPLSTFLEETILAFPPRRRARVGQAAAAALGTFLARLHEAGIVHQDLHAGNLLVHLTADDQLSLYLIDLHAVRLGGPLAWPARCENLVVLNRWFAMRANRSDRLRFWDAYCDTWQRTPDPLRIASRADAARDLERRTWESNLAFWRNRDRRCLRTNRYYYRLSSPAAAGHAVRDLAPETFRGLLIDPDAPFAQEGIRLLKDSRSSTVAEWQLAVGGASRPVIYKRFRVTEWSDPWAALVRRPAALRSWVYGHGLRERCLPTARPLAVLFRRRNGLLTEGYLLTEKIPDALDLHAFLHLLHGLPAAEARSRLRRLVEQVARVVRELHRRRLGHRDLKAANLLVSGGQVWLIDLVGVACYRRLSRRRRVQNLARLNASFHGSPALTRTDRLRFLRVYLQWGLLGRGTWKRWWRAVAAATEVKVARNARNGRPLA